MCVSCKGLGAFWLCAYTREYRIRLEAIDSYRNLDSLLIHRDTELPRLLKTFWDFWQREVDPAEDPLTGFGVRQEFSAKAHLTLGIGEHAKGIRSNLWQNQVPSFTEFTTRFFRAPGLRKTFTGLQTLKFFHLQ